MTFTVVVSVPLSGLISVNYILSLVDSFSDSGFRPLIGVNFCKRSYYFIIGCKDDGFRPLIGVNFCKQ